MKKLKFQYRDVLLTILVVVLIVNVLQNQLLLNQLTETRKKEAEKVSNFTQYNANPQNFAVLPVNPDGSLNIRIKGFSERMEVDIARISTFDELDVNLDDVSSSATLNVDIED